MFKSIYLVGKLTGTITNMVIHFKFKLLERVNIPKFNPGEVKVSQRHQSIKERENFIFDTE